MIIIWMFSSLVFLLHGIWMLSSEATLNLFKVPVLSFSKWGFILSDSLE